MPRSLSSRQIRDNLDGFTAQFQDTFIAAVRGIQSDTQIGLVAEAIERGDIEDAIRLMNMSPEFFDTLQVRIGDMYRQGGVDAVAAVSGLAAPFRPQDAELWRALAALIRAHNPK